MFSKTDAVNLDEQFIDWIAHAEGSFEKCQDKRFIAVCPHIGDSCVDMFGFDKLGELSKYFEEWGDDERGDAPLEAIFDMKEKRELKFKEEHKVIIAA